MNGQAFTLSRNGGWFGFLGRHRLLTPTEASTVEVAAEFLLWIEHGSYTKSFKLVTLAALARSGRLRTGMSLTELAATCRWDVLRDVDLRADLSDATGSFADISSPTPPEWLRYWRKNPINALTTATLGSEPWFTVAEDTLLLNLEIPAELGETFDTLVSEMVEYRLHRYLAQRQARRVGERRTFAQDGLPLDAAFTVESSGNRPTSVLIESAGGTRGSESARNVDYLAGFDLLLQRLRGLGARVLDIYIDTGRTKDLSLSDRRLVPGNESYPLRLDEIDDLVELRKNLLRSMARAGRSVESSGGGNARKRTRFVVAVDDAWTSAAFADALASGHFVGGTAEPTRLSDRGG